jgi:uncharacterized membrane protein
MDQAMVEAAAAGGLALIGSAIDVAGVLVILAGLIWATAGFALRHRGAAAYEAYRGRIGRSLLLGLEMLVAADIVKTIALEPTFRSLGVLAGLVLVRTFLSWSLVLEIEGHWPWQSPRPIGQESRHDRQV